MFRSKSGATLASKIAHTTTIPALGNKDLKLLQDLITNEKAILVTLQKLAVDLSRASESLKSWGLGEGEDLGDILSHSASIYAHISTALNNFANHGHTVRAHLKAIRTREERLDELKRKRKSVAAKADAADKKLSKMSGENKNLPAQTELLTRLRDEIRQLDTEIMVDEARLSDFKRQSTRNFMALKLGGLLEFGEKATIVGELGKLLIDEIPLEPTPPGQPRTFYQSHAKTENLVAEVSRCVGEVVFTAPPDINDNSGAYAVPTSSDLTRPSVDFQPPAVDAGYSAQATNELRVMNTNSGFSQDGLPPNEFGEASGQRRYGSGPVRLGDDGSRIGLDGGGGGGGGGQFSTFPVKARSNTALSAGLNDDSFSASVVSALQYADGDGVGGERKEERDNSRSGLPPPSVNIGGSPWTGNDYSNSHARSGSQDSSRLPYAQESQNQRAEALGVEKGVRFRTPSMEVSGMGPVAPGVASPMYPSAGSGWAGRGTGTSLYDAPVSPTQPDIVEEDEYVEDTQGGSEQITLENDYYRNSVAAREIAREMDELQFPPQPSQPPGYQPPSQSYQPSATLQPTRPLSIARTPSPLSPPQAPFAQPRSVSPNPAVTGMGSPIPESPRFASGGPSSPVFSDTTSYATPPEFPTPPLQSAPSTPGVSGSNPSAPRMISAAAFKRAGRSGSDADLTKKRALPSSPYPNRSAASGLSQNSSQDNLNNSSGRGAQPPDYFRSSQRDPGSPTATDYGALGGVRVANVNDNQDSPGYNRSQFVTRLDH